MWQSVHWGLYFSSLFWSLYRWSFDTGKLLWVYFLGVLFYSKMTLGPLSASSCKWGFFAIHVLICMVSGVIGFLKLWRFGSCFRFGRKPRYCLDVSWITINSLMCSGSRNFWTPLDRSYSWTGPLLSPNLLIYKNNGCFYPFAFYMLEFLIDFILARSIRETKMVRRSMTEVGHQLTS